MPTKRFDRLDPAKRAVLLEAAAAEFAEHGFTGASMNRIIAAAGTSKGSMYYYFEDKADLYTTVVWDTVQRFIAWCGPPKQVEDAEAYWAEVERMTRRGFDYYSVDPHVAGVLRSVGRDGLAAAPLQQTRRVLAGWMEGLLLVGQSVGAVRQDLPRSLILAVVTSLSEGIDLWLAENLDNLEPAEREALIVRLTDMYRRLGAPLESP